MAKRWWWEATCTGGWVWPDEGKPLVLREPSIFKKYSDNVNPHPGVKWTDKDTNIAYWGSAAVSMQSWPFRTYGNLVFCQQLLDMSSPHTCIWRWAQSLKHCIVQTDMEDYVLPIITCCEDWADCHCKFVCIMPAHTSACDCSILVNALVDVFILLSQGLESNWILGPQLDEASYNGRLPRGEFRHIWLRANILFLADTVHRRSLRWRTSLLCSYWGLRWRFTTRSPVLFRRSIDQLNSHEGQLRNWWAFCACPKNWCSIQLLICRKDFVDYCWQAEKLAHVFCPYCWTLLVCFYWG